MENPHSRFLLSAFSLLCVFGGVAAAGEAMPDTGVPPSSLLTNPGFEEIHKVDGVNLPVSWTAARWNNQETMVPTTMGRITSTGKQVVRVPACTSGTIGLTSDAQPIPGDSPYLSVDLNVIQSWDCTSTPVVFITWYKGDALLGQSDLKFEIDRVGAWQLFTWDVPHWEIPAGAESFRLNLAMKGKQGPLAGFVLYDDAVVATRSVARPIHLRPAAEFAWFEEQPVKYVCDRTPMELVAVKGTVYDSNGKNVAVVTVKRDKFVRNGWVWNAPAPGLYDIAFECIGADGAKAMTRPWVMSSKGKSATFVKERYTAAVVKKGQWKERPAQFGIDQQGTSQENEIRMGARFGFSFARKWIDWGSPAVSRNVINPAPGVYKWDLMDRYWVLCKQYGFKHNLATFFGTPDWASPYPDKNEIDLVVSKFQEYPPTDMKYFTDFVAAAVERYGADVKDWEIWNEEHLPKSTCFWKGTPSDYAALLKAGYETVKRVQPESTVWLGGMAPRRYEPFYKEFLKTDGYPYFDRYSAHGSFPDIGICHRLEAEAGLKSKPWSASEWHPILVNAGDPVQSESDLGRRMMTDLFLQLKNGADRIVAFTLRNGIEMEALSFVSKSGGFSQSFGFFRMMPEFEPRLPAVILHDFLTRISGRIDYTAEYDFGTQKAVLLTTGGKKLLLAVWNEGTSPAPLDPRLAKIASSASSATTWEGKPWKDDQLGIATMVYFANVDRAALDALKLPATALFYPAPQTKSQPSASANVCQGLASSLPLFAQVTDEPGAQISWIADKMVFKAVNGAAQPAGFSARFAVHTNKDGVDLVVDVRDAVHFQNSKPEALSNGDSIQFAVNAESNTEGSGVTELSVAQTPDGPVIWKNAAAFIGGDLPSYWTPAGAVVKNARVDVKKTDGGLLYKVHVDWSEFYPFQFDPKKPLRFSLVVNDNDGNGRLGWLEWGGGIAGAKDPSKFGKIQ